MPFQAKKILKDEIESSCVLFGSFMGAMLQTRARRFGIFFDHTTEPDRREYATPPGGHTAPHAHSRAAPLKAA
jgi:hypothetical protein